MNFIFNILYYVYKTSNAQTNKLHSILHFCKKILTFIIIIDVVMSRKRTGSKTCGRSCDNVYDHVMPFNVYMF